MRTKHHLKQTRVEKNRSIHGLILAGVIIALLLIGTVAILDPDTSTASAAGVDTTWYDGGTGTYEISTAEELAGLASVVNGGNDLNGSTIDLTASIDLSSYSAGAGWTPIGTTLLSGKLPFNGTFDGHDLVIQNLTVNTSATPNADFAGLFGNVGPYGTVENLGIVGGSVISRNYVGGVAGWNEGKILNCYNDGCSVAGTNSDGYVGGVVGWSYIGSTIENCYNTGTVGNGNESYVGGVAGENDGTISNCYNTGPITGKDSVGGIAGVNPGMIENCYNTGAVSFGNMGNSSAIGGVVSSNGGTIENCYNTGTVNGGTGQEIGGVAGVNGGTALNCYNTGAVSGTTTQGASFPCIGGVFGNNQCGEVSGCYNTGEVSGSCNTTTTFYIGGVVGRNYGDGHAGQIASNCYNTGNVISSGSGNYVGGVIGYNCYCKLSNCYNFGLVGGNGNHVGGVVGYNSSGTISYCYNTGAVSCNGNDIGGVAGLNDDIWNGGGLNSTIGNCYNAGALSGSGNNIGGVIGTNNGYMAVSYCYYDSDYADCGVGTGKGTMTALSTAQMVNKDVLSGDMGQLGSAFDKRDADADCCYYPELTVFSGNTPGTNIPDSVQSASRASVAVARIPLELSATTDPIFQGQKLDDSNLSVTAIDPMGNPVDGTPKWDDGSMTPSHTADFEYIFIPWSELYKNVIAETTVIVIAPPVNEYNITATSDSNSSITPNGAVAVQSGGSQTFTFSASPGYSISSVTVDRTLLTQDQISAGRYTFTNVIADHSIEVKSSIDSGAADNQNVTGDNGNDNDASDGSGNGSDGGHDDSIIWWALSLIVILTLIFLLIWFLLFYRIYYDIIMVEASVKIIGKDKAHRKSEYRFSIDGVFSGKISYRVGEEGQWKTISPGADGEYIIPRKDVTDNITIETR